MKVTKIITIQNLCSVGLGSLITLLVYNNLIYNVIPKADRIIGQYYLLKQKQIIVDNTQFILGGIFLALIVFILPVFWLVKKNEIKNARLYFIMEIVLVILMVSLIVSVIKGQLSFTSIVSLFISTVIFSKFLLMFLAYSIEIIKEIFLEKKDIAVTIIISIITTIIMMLSFLLGFKR